MSQTFEEPKRLTRKGEATRARIVDAAAALIYEHGVKDTNNEMVRRAAGVSGSQLQHYFADKQQLVRAVIARRVDSMRGRDQTPGRGPFDSVEAFERWAEDYIANPVVARGGCSFGSLSSEVLKSEPDLHDAIAVGFEEWAGDFRGGLEAMKDKGILRPDAEPDQLTHMVMAAFQGGMLLAQAQRDVAPLRDALRSAVETIRAATTPQLPV
jgi:TetR/AcrR family transcriptional regulator, transcriptional repressor for nem operon